MNRLIRLLGSISAACIISLVIALAVLYPLAVIIACCIVIVISLILCIILSPPSFFN